MAPSLSGHVRGRPRPRLSQCPAQGPRM